MLEQLWVCWRPLLVVTSQSLVDLSLVEKQAVPDLTSPVWEEAEVVTVEDAVVDVKVVEETRVVEEEAEAELAALEVEEAWVEVASAVVVASVDEVLAVEDDLAEDEDFASEVDSWVAVAVASEAELSARLRSSWSLVSSLHSRMASLVSLLASSGLHPASS